MNKYYTGECIVVVINDDVDDNDSDDVDDTMIVKVIVKVMI
jgi:hypothetical protein